MNRGHLLWLWRNAFILVSFTDTSFTCLSIICRNSSLWGWDTSFKYSLRLQKKTNMYDIINTTCAHTLPDCHITHVRAFICNETHAFIHCHFLALFTDIHHLAIFGSTPNIDIPILLRTLVLQWRYQMRSISIITVSNSKSHIILHLLLHSSFKYNKI